MSGPLPDLSCRKCGTTNPPVYLAPVTVGRAGTCICIGCAEARGWLDRDGNVKKGIAL
ncbi:hypothetical protein ACIPCF_18855 (plasmid) [Paracoccus marcusii]|uniref:hypothetical protein n=1 Tax=Paracoccus marcusii TaxID=59779 RepID=UPI0038B7E792